MYGYEVDMNDIMIVNTTIIMHTLRTAWYCTVVITRVTRYNDYLRCVYVVCLHPHHGPTNRTTYTNVTRIILT